MSTIEGGRGSDPSIVILCCGLLASAVDVSVSESDEPLLSSWTIEGAMAEELAPKKSKSRGSEEVAATSPALSDFLRFCVDFPLAFCTGKHKATQLMS
jgi:hypothetical protein